MQERNPRFGTCSAGSVLETKCKWRTIGFVHIPQCTHYKPHAQTSDRRGSVKRTRPAEAQTLPRPFISPEHVAYRRNVFFFFFSIRSKVPFSQRHADTATSIVTTQRPVREVSGLRTCTLYASKHGVDILSVNWVQIETFNDWDTPAND